MIDENGQPVNCTTADLPQSIRSNLSVAEALQIAMLCVSRELRRSDMTNQYTEADLQNAEATLGDILAQRGCEELTADNVDYLTQVISIAVYG